MKLDYEYFPIPKQLLSCKSVNGFKWNGDAKNLYFKMDKESKFYTEKYGYYEPSNEALAYSMGITEKTVRNIIGRLEDAGLCVCTNKGVKGVKLKYKVTHWKDVPEITAMLSDHEERIRKGGSTSFEDYHEEQDSDMTLVDTGKPVTIEKPPEAPQEPVIIQNEPTYQEQERTPQEAIQEQIETISDDVLTRFFKTLPSKPEPSQYNFNIYRNGITNGMPIANAFREWEAKQID